MFLDTYKNNFRKMRSYNSNILLSLLFVFILIAVITPRCGNDNETDLSLDNYELSSDEVVDNKTDSYEIQQLLDIEDIKDIKQSQDSIQNSEGCEDKDGDGYGVGNDCVGIDVDDMNPNCDYIFIDNDNDGYCINHDTNDNNPYCRSEPIDNDTDGYCIDFDCNDNSIACTTECRDSNGDGIIDCCITDPHIIGSYISFTLTKGLFLKDNYLYLTDEVDGLLIIDISDLRHPTLLNNYPILDANDVYVDGSYAYVVDRNFGLQIINIEDPNNLILVGSWYVQGGSGAESINGRYPYVYVGDSDMRAGLSILDISDPTAPNLVGSYHNFIRVGDIELKDNYIYIADPSMGVHIIDVEDPTAPNLVSTINYIPGGAYGIYLKNNYAFVSDGGPRLLHIIDITQPNIPVLVATYNIPGGIIGKMFVKDNYLFTGTEEGLSIIDIQNILNPIVISSLNISGDRSVTKVYVEGSYIFVNVHWLGLLIISLNCE